MFTDKASLEDGDIESGSSYGHASDIGRKASSVEASTDNMSYGGDIKSHDADIDKWASSMKRKLEDVPKYMCHPGHPGRICRIPENLREIDVNAYEPYYLPIGPYHHGKPRLESMEKRKQILLKFFLNYKPELTLKDYLEEVGSIELAARSFYSDVEMDSEKFVHMLLLDSLFLLTTFCGVPKSQKQMTLTNTQGECTVGNEGLNEDERMMPSMEPRDEDENLSMMARKDEPKEATKSMQNVQPRLLSSLIVHDLFLLENQFPFFVLQKMHNFIYGGPKTIFIDTTKARIRNILIGYTTLDSELHISPTEEVHHLLHLCHMFFRPTIKYESSTYELIKSNQMFRLGSAVQLYQSGVSFVAKPDSTEHSLVDVTFCSSGKMTMPCLHVDDYTNSLLRNLIALEQMKYPSMGLHVSAYAVLLLHLVTIPEDVCLLRRKGIMQPHLASDKEMLYLVNRLSVGLAFDYVEDNYSLKPVFRELKLYSDRKVPRWRAWLKHRHCNNPWTVISLLAASLLLFLSAVQTYYAVYSYYHPYFGGHL